MTQGDLFDEAKGEQPESLLIPARCPVMGTRSCCREGCRHYYQGSCKHKKADLKKVE